MNKKDLKGYCPSKGHQVQFEVMQTDKGSQATNVTVLAPPEELSYFGQIKSFNQNRGSRLRVALCLDHRRWFGN